MISALTPLALLAAAATPAQEPTVDPMPYVRLHHSADRALEGGDLDAARTRFLRCLELSPENATVAYGLAAAESGAGNAGVALDWLERAVSWGYRDAALAAWDEDLAALRGEERFGRALAAMRAGANDQDEDGINPVRLLCPPACAWPTTCCIDSGGDTVLVGYQDGSLSLVDALTGVRIRRLHPFPSYVWATAFSSDGSTFAALGHDGRVGIWRVGQDEPVALEPAMRTPPSTAARLGVAFGEEVSSSGMAPDALDQMFGAFLEFDPSGERLLVAAWDLGGSLWTRSGECVRRWNEPLGHFFAVPLAWSPDGGTIAWAKDDSVRFFDGRNGRPLGSDLNCGDEVRCLTYHPDGAVIATGHTDGRVREWKLADLSRLAERTAELPPTYGFPDESIVLSVTYSADGRRMACTTGVSVFAAVFDLQTAEQIWVSEHSGGRMGEPAPVRWSPDGQRLWYAFASGVMALHTVEPAPGAAVDNLADGFVPSLSGTNQEGTTLGATVLDRSAVAVLDGSSSTVRWIRVEDEDGGALLQAPTGHFATELESIAGWTLSAGIGDDPVDIAPQVELLFDPKRVRASCAGVRIVPIR